MAICSAHYPEYEDDCYRCHLVSFQLAPSATPSRHPEAKHGNAEEARRNRDLPAFERMRKAGMQPASTLNAYHMEKVANTKWEVEHNQPLPKGVAEKAEQAEKDLRKEGVI